MNSEYDEMIVWTRMIMGAGYPASHLVPYLMDEFELEYDAISDLLSDLR